MNGAERSEGGLMGGKMRQSNLRVPIVVHCHGGREAMAKRRELVVEVARHSP